MKTWLALVMALVVLSSTLIPCCPMDGCSQDKTHQAPLQQEDHEEGGCSPFFSCGSCSGFVQTARQVAIPRPPLKPVVHFDKTVDYFPPPFHTTLFQPPRVSI